MPRSRPTSVDQLAVDAAPRPCRRQQAGDRLQDRRLAAAGRAEEDDDLAAVRLVDDVEGDVAHRLGRVARRDRCRSRDRLLTRSFGGAPRRSRRYVGRAAPAVADRRRRRCRARRPVDAGASAAIFAHAVSRQRKSTLEISRMRKSVSRPMPPMTSRPANDHDAFWCVRASSTM